MTETVGEEIVINSAIDFEQLNEIEFSPTEIIEHEEEVKKPASKHLPVIFPPDFSLSIGEPQTMYPKNGAPFTVTNST